MKYTKGEKTRLSANFNSTEFDCHGQGCCAETEIDPGLVDIVQKIRSHFGKPVKVSSGYRCPVHNKNVGGATGSRHGKGMAADIYIDGIAPAEIAKYAEGLGIKGIGLYETDEDGHFVHVDTRTTKSYWYGQAQKKRDTFGGQEVEKKVDATKVDTSPIDAKKMWNFFVNAGMTEHGAAGLMGNLYAESGLRPTNLQNSYEKKIGMNDAEYTAAVDAGTYVNFEQDRAGYGLAQWTYWRLKLELYEYARLNEKSIGDGDMQMEFLVKQLKSSYAAVWKVLTSTNDLREASNVVLMKFEQPSDQGESVQAMRANYGQKYYDQYATKKVEPEVKPATRGTLRIGSTGEMVKALQSVLNGMGYNCGKVDGIFGKDTETALKEFQYDNDLVKDGVCGTITWDALDKANYYKAKVTANVLNVRSGPGTSHSIKTTVKKDTVVTVVSIKNNFARLIKNGGYVSLDYIKKI